MRVLFFSNLFPTACEPARGTFNLQLTEHLAKLCDITVMAPLPWFPDSALVRRLFPGHSRLYSGIPLVEQRGGMEVWHPRYPVIPGWMDSIHSEAMQIGIRGIIKVLHRRHRFDVINSHWLYPDGVVAARVGSRLGVPVVLTALGSDVNAMMQTRARRRAILAAAAQSAAVSVVAAPLAEALRAQGVEPSKLHTIANGVDLERFQIRDRNDCRRQLGIPADVPVVVCVARLSAEKGVAVLIRALKAVLQQLPRARLYLVGEGGQRGELQRLCVELGISQSVTFAGAVPHESIPQWFAAATVACLSSFREGHPNALMEALACGIPTVASRVGSIPEYVNALNGRIVEPGDATGFAAALVDSLQRDWDASAIAASAGVRSWSVVARDYVDLYRRVTNDDLQARTPDPAMS